MKIFPRFKSFKKKRQEQLQEKETEDRDISEHSSQESVQVSIDLNTTDDFYKILQCSDENVDVTNSSQESQLGLENVDVTNATDDFDKKVKELIECCAFLECLQRSDENVDVTNTTDDFYTNFKELIEGYENDKGEFIDMSQPRDASYATETDINDDTYQYETVDTERLGKDVHLTSAAKHFGIFRHKLFKHQDDIKNESFDPYRYRSMDTKVRGITLRQLRAIIPLIKRRCEEENWTRQVYKDGRETDEIEKVTLENATLYDINKYIIRPFTKFSQKSFVETLPSTKGTQPPRWFVSHYWGETFVHTMACLEQMVKDFEADGERKGGGMTEDTPVWICAFANNQHKLESEITANPADSAFAKAMKIANFRVISILDVNSQVYTRLWCMYELYLTLLLSKGQGVLAIYTYHEHESDYDGMLKAVGLIEGGATSDGTVYNRRQKHFPGERLLPFLSVSIQNAVASRKEDRIHILNSLAEEEDLDAEPLKHHEKYDELHDAIQSAVFSSQATLNLVYETDETEEKEYWNSALSALEKSTLKEFRFDLDRKSEKPLLTRKVMAEVCHHLPIELEKLEIDEIPHGRVTMDALLHWLENKSTNLKTLSIRNKCIGGEVGGKECGERLAKFLAKNDCKIEEIALSRTDLIGSRNVNTWIECLEKNESLKKVAFVGLAPLAERVRESEKPNTSISSVKNTKFYGKIYWDGTKFPDTTLSIEQEKVLVETVSIRKHIAGFVLDKRTAHKIGAKIVDNEVDMDMFETIKALKERVSRIENNKGFVLEKGTAKAQQEESETPDNEVQMVKETVLEESTDVGEKSTSNWLCGGVDSCF